MKRVEITNYESIKKAVVELSPGVNILIGPSDSGKSAFIRAIRDCCFNATGTGFIHAGQKKTTVAIDQVQWEKSKSVNRYTVTRGGEHDLRDEGVRMTLKVQIGEPVVYDKVGRTAPDQVGEELGIREIEFGDGVKRRLQFAFQLDHHFMLGDNPADNAKVLGKLADLHTVYNAIREGERLLKGFNREAEHVNTELVARETELEEAVLEHREAASECEALEKVREQIEPVHDRCNALMESGRDLEVLLYARDALAGEIEQVPTDEWFDKAHRLQALLRVRKVYTLALCDVEVAENKVQPAPGYKFSEASDWLLGLVKARDRMQVLQSDVAQLRSRQRSIPDVDAVVEHVGRLRAFQGAYHSHASARDDVLTLRERIVDNKAKAMKIKAALAGVTVCPTCGKPTEFKV